MKTVDTTDYHNFTYYAMPTARRRQFDVGDIFENIIECNKCKWICRSRNRHDMVTCRCGAVSVDGGSWYSKQHGDKKDITSHVRMFKYRPRN